MAQNGPELAYESSICVSISFDFKSTEKQGRARKKEEQSWDTMFPFLIGLILGFWDYASVLSLNNSSKK